MLIFKHKINYMIYSQSKYTKLFFFVPPKCGWGSFYKLYQNKHLINCKEYYFNIEKKIWVDVFLVRNPYYRVISAFKDKFRKTILNETTGEIHDTIKQIFQLNSYEEILNISFEQYLEKLAILKEKDVHFFSLRTFYEHCIKTPSYVCEINNKIVEDLLGCQITNENDTSTITPVILNENYKNIIKNIYKEDFDLFYK